jgi:hypothetical protein
LEEYLEGEGSPDSGFLFVDSGSRKNPNFGQFTEEEYYVMEWSYMCKQCGESIDHLFLHYEIANDIWNVFLQLIDVDWVMPRSVSDCLGSWRRQLGNRLALHIRRTTPLCVMWCLLRERNA